MNAHLLNHTVAGQKLYLVVLSTDSELAPQKHYSSVMVGSISQAFYIAASHNAPLLQGGKQLLEGDFQ